jgi:hypothetical protein
MLFVESEVDSLKLFTMVILRQHVIAQLMSGIDRDITPDPRPSLIDRHLPNTPQVQRLLQREGRAHVFSDLDTLKRVTQSIIAGGERTGIEDEGDDYERYGLYFSEPIGYIIKADGSQIPLYYGEIKIVKTTGEYHAIPRTSPRRTS